MSKPRRPYVTVKRGVSTKTNKPYWRFRQHAGNGKIITRSETYQSRRAARSAIWIVAPGWQVKWL